jgi:tetratricopeptide (TPR) repeat protein
MVGLLTLGAASFGTAGCGGDADEGAVRLQSDLGEHHHPISTDSELAQRYFDQGLNLIFGFNHELSVLSFREAAIHDPECAMCFWGVALALGPNINAPMGPEAGAAAWEALGESQARLEHASDAERAYIHALSKRYAENPQAKRGPLDRAFANAMGEVHRRYPDDVDAATIYAEALMDLFPWDYYLKDGTPRPETLTALDALEAVLDQAPYHPGANHYWIHALEKYDPHRHRAEAAADRLVAIAPDAGHLVHMPSHIYWRVGRYEDAARVNVDAAEADEALFAWCSDTAFYAAGYYTHNIHFLWAAAMVSGQSDRALTAARRLVSKVPQEMVPEYPFLEDYLAVPVVTLARFAKWDQLLAEPAPPDSQRFVTAIWHYGRGLAQARKGDLEEAGQELAALRVAHDDPSLAEIAYDPGGNTAGHRLRLALRHLEAEIALAEERVGDAIAALQKGVAVQDAMAYIEPPAWYLPTRQVLGAVLLDAGKDAEAERVFRKNLELYPRNGWALRGLQLALERQGREVDAEWVRRGFENAWSEADVRLESSRLHGRRRRRAEHRSGVRPRSNRVASRSRAGP